MPVSAEAQHPKSLGHNALKPAQSFANLSIFLCRTPEFEGVVKVVDLGQLNPPACEVVQSILSGQKVI